MKKGVIITIVIVAVVLIGAVVAYFLLSKDDNKNGNGETNGTKYIVATADTALNVRKDASTSSDKLGTVEKGDFVFVTETKNNFGYVPNLGGWLSMDYLTKA